MNSKEKISKLMDDVDEYLRLKGIPSASIGVFLSMSSQELLSMSTEDLFGMAYELESHGFLIQNLFNQKQTLVEACKKKIQNTVGTKLHEYSIFGNVEKLRYAIADNDVASEVDKMMEGPALIVTRLTSLAFKIGNLSRIANDLAKSRRKEYNA
jgi:hypothetical protein